MSPHKDVAHSACGCKPNGWGIRPGNSVQTKDRSTLKGGMENKEVLKTHQESLRAQFSRLILPHMRQREGNPVRIAPPRKAISKDEPVSRGAPHQGRTDPRRSVRVSQVPGSTPV